MSRTRMPDCVVVINNDVVERGAAAPIASPGARLAAAWLYRSPSDAD